MLLKNTCRYCLQMLLQEAAVITVRINEFLEADLLSASNDEQQHHVRLGFRLEANCYDQQEVNRLEAGLICEEIEYEDDGFRTEVREDESNLEITTEEHFTEDDSTLANETLKSDEKMAESEDPALEQEWVALAEEEDMENPESIFIILDDEEVHNMAYGETQETNDDENIDDGAVAEQSYLSDSSSDLPAPRPFACTECDKCFKRYQDLKQHSLIHSGFKPFVCDVCGRSFRQKNTLQTHQALHYGKTIECSECDKKFARRSHLLKHISAHRGERPFRCTYLNCKAAYATRTLLVAHQQMHVGVREYTCELCGGAFFNRHGLLGHMYGVHSNFSYECEQCKKNFTKPYNIRKHMRNLHGIEIGSVAHLKKIVKKESLTTDELDSANADVELI